MKPEKELRVRNVPSDHPFRVKLKEYHKKHKLKTLADSLEKLAQEGW